ncbi:MAG: SRPBCC family protein [Acidimicrobiia bacterium]|nr:SRPBCC family protein [Acidimicrobiia bacterium]
MNEDDLIVARPSPSPDMMHETGHALAGVHRVEEHPLERGAHLDGLVHRIGRNPVGVTHVGVVNYNGGGAEGAVEAELLDDPFGKRANDRCEVLVRTTRTHAQNRHRRPLDREPGDEPGLRAAGAGGMDDLGRGETHGLGLSEDLHRGGAVTERPDDRGSAERDGIRPATGCQEFIDPSGERSVHVGADRIIEHSGAEQRIELEVAAPVVGVGPLGESMLEQEFALDTEAGSGGSGLPAVIALRRTDREHDVGTPADWTDRAPLKIRAVREIRATPQEVWDVLCDHERWPEWFSALDKAEATGGTGLGSTRTVWVAKKPIHEEFIVWDEPRSWGFSVVEAEGPLGLVTETLNERVDIQVLSDDRVRVTYLMALQPKPRTGLLFRVLKRQLTKTLRQSLAGLERRLEAQRA